LSGKAEICHIESARRTIIVLGATNQPWELDNGIKRRFQKRIFIALPGLDERRALLQLQLRCVFVGANVVVDALVARLESYSGPSARRRPSRRLSACRPSCRRGTASARA
jgi:SpoVK/Ycf46/Vps4 family AAA+-type ATPase